MINTAVVTGNSKCTIEKSDADNIEVMLLMVVRIHNAGDQSHRMYLK